MSASRVSPGRHVLLAVYCLMASGILAAPALATEKWALTGQFNGSEAPGGAFSEPVRVAVDESSEPALDASAGDVYVADRGRNVVDKFDSQGRYVSQIADTPTGPEGSPESFSELGAVAVDNSPGPARGDVYVVDYGHNRVDEFSPTGAYLGRLTGKEPIVTVAFGPEDTLWVGELRQIDVIKEAGNGESQIYPIPAEGPGGTNGENQGIAVDANNHVYVLDGRGREGGELDRWGISTSGSQHELTEATLVSYVDEELPSSVLYFTPFALDLSTSSVFADICKNVSGTGTTCHIVKYGPVGGSEESVASGNSVDGSRGVAVNGAKGVVYVTSIGATGNNTVSSYAKVSLGPPEAITGPVRDVTETTVQVTGEVNPQALPTTWFFQYGTSPAYGQSVPAGAAGEDAAPVPVSAALQHLEPGVTYHYRLVAENQDGAVYGTDQTFTAEPYPPPTVTTGPAETITQTSATITATVNPHGLLVHYTFEVGASTAYGASIPGIIPGSNVQTLRLVLTNLVPETTYHYRLVANNQGGVGAGEDLTFTTASQLFPGTLLPPTQSPQLAEEHHTKKLPPKLLTNSQKLSNALKTCKTRHNRRTRAACESRARKKYTPPKKTKKQ